MYKLVSDHLLISLSVRYFTHEKMLMYLMLLMLNMALMFCKINTSFPVNRSSDEWNFVILFDIVKLRNSNYRICIKITDWSNEHKHIWTAQWIFNCLEKDMLLLIFCIQSVMMSLLGIWVGIQLINVKFVMIQNDPLLYLFGISFIVHTQCDASEVLRNPPV